MSVSLWRHTSLHVEDYWSIRHSVLNFLLILVPWYELVALPAEEEVPPTRPTQQQSKSKQPAGVAREASLVANIVGNPMLHCDCAIDKRLLLVLASRQPLDRVAASHQAATHWATTRRTTRGCVCQQLRRQRRASDGSGPAMVRRLVALALVLALLAAAPSPSDGAVNGSVISVFGSSVADGAFCGGNCSGHGPATPGVGGCYQSRLRAYQATYGNRSVFNNCHGGDTTTKLLARFYQFLSSKAELVVIGLSLANEGLGECRVVPAACQQVFDHYKSGMLQLIKQIRAAGAQPIVASCYPNSDYNPQQYSFIRQMNLLTQSSSAEWNVPNVNFLGTIDDGQGRWVDGFHANSGHPNNNGSTEMYYAFVPSLFDAIQAGKPAKPKRADGSQFLRLGSPAVLFAEEQEPPEGAGAATAGVQWAPAPQDTMHSFTLALNVRCHSAVTCAGELASINVEQGPMPAPPRNTSACDDFCAEHSYPPDQCHCGVCGSFGGCTFSCTADPEAHRYKCPAPPRASETAAAAVAATAAAAARTLTIDSNGGLSYSGAAPPSKPSASVAGGAWHTVALTHYWCNGSTALYVDNALVSRTTERLRPLQFSLGGGRRSWR
eukprot:COSAG01_NODE_2353_length_7849_cov_4.770194_5_plen_607_part_00